MILVFSIAKQFKKMRTDLNFEDSTTKRMLSKYDFKFFLMENIQRQKYNQAEVDLIFSSYSSTKSDIRTHSAKNRKQFYYLSEGEVRKMFSDGLLPSLFGLNDIRELQIIDFSAIGDNWAYFDLWKRCFRRENRRSKIWDTIIKVGSVLGILLSIITLLESLNLLRLTSHV